MKRRDFLKGLIATPVIPGMLKKAKAVELEVCCDTATTCDPATVYYSWDKDNAFYLWDEEKHDWIQC
jgi:hypothetical protein